MKVRHTPVTVDAWRVEQNLENAPRWVQRAVSEGVLKLRIEILSTKPGFEGPALIVHLETADGLETAKTGDWIICGVHGELYPVNAARFEQNYEVLEPETVNP